MISIFHRRTALYIGAGMLLTIAYIAACVIWIGVSWQANEGDRAPVSPAIAKAADFFFGFPFFQLGVTDSILVLPVVNGLFWGFALVALLAGIHRIRGRFRRGARNALRENHRRAVAEMDADGRFPGEGRVLSRPRDPAG